MLKKLLAELGMSKQIKKSLDHITKAKQMCTKYDLTAEDLTEMYIRYNRMRQEQNFIRKIDGPNLLEVLVNLKVMFNLFKFL